MTEAEKVVQVQCWERVVSSLGEGGHGIKEAYLRWNSQSPQESLRTWVSPSLPRYPTDRRDLLPECVLEYDGTSYTERQFIRGF